MNNRNRNYGMKRRKSVRRLLTIRMLLNAPKWCDFVGEATGHWRFSVIELPTDNTRLNRLNRFFGSWPPIGSMQRRHQSSLRFYQQVSRPRIAHLISKETFAYTTIYYLVFTLSAARTNKPAQPCTCWLHTYKYAVLLGSLRLFYTRFFEYESETDAFQFSMNIIDFFIFIRIRIWATGVMTQFLALFRWSCYPLKRKQASKIKKRWIK